MNAIFTDASFQNMDNIANRYGISVNAVTDLTHALMLSNGTMAQFYVPELGGGGQWMQGGMTMVGDMFNYQLKNTVDSLCNELSNMMSQGLIEYKPIPQSSNNNQGANVGNWWGDLGFPNSTGSQNNTSYAIFSNIARLAIQENGKVTVFNTLDHQIGGTGQQQGGNYSVTFTSQYGTVDLGTLPIVSGEEKATPVVPHSIQHTNEINHQFTEVAQELTTGADEIVERDIFLKLEKIADLKNKGIITVEEFETTKSTLLSRL
ncbi:SHOCT domain-containing protein [Wenyingzhuangia sp. IMCC45533]